MRKVSFLFLLVGLLLSLGAVNFCSAQWQRFGPEVRRWEIDGGNGQFWSMDTPFPHLGLKRSKTHRVAISMPEGRVLKLEEMNLITGIIRDDFLVNNDTIGGCSQFSPAVAMDALGNFVVCWGDERNGQLNPDIYAQRYSSSGDTLGSNFRVNDNAGSSEECSPSIVMDGYGNFIICWQDDRYHHYDIYAQRYSSLGDPLGTNFRVNDDAGISWQVHPSIAMGGYGNFILCWLDDRNGNWDIYAQRYNSSGDALGSNFQVNGDTGSSAQYFPSMSMGVDGDFVICWQDLRHGDWDIYAQRYNSSGDTLGANFRVNNDVGTSEQSSPSIAIDADGDFVICWQDDRGTGVWWMLDIYAQRYNSSGDTIGSNFRVNDDTCSSSQWPSPSVAMDADGGFVICWGSSDIYAQRYSRSGDTLGANFRVNDDAGIIWLSSPSVSMDGDDGFVICWADRRNGWYNPDIYAQRYNSSGDALDSNFRVNDDVGSSEQMSLSVSMDVDGGFVICWADRRNGWYNPDIYAQRYNSSGDTLGANFKVNDDTSSNSQYSPSIAMDANGNFVICWKDDRNDAWDIYAQRYRGSGDRLGVNFKVNNVAANHRSPSIAVDADGDFVICWYDKRVTPRGDIYAQRYSSSGDTLGSNFRVNDDVGISGQYSPSIAMDGNGGFVICWRDGRNGNSDIYAQRYNSSGDTLGANFRVNDNVGVDYPSIAMDMDGGFVICWVDERDGTWNIYAQRYSSSGDTLGANFRVNDDAGTSSQWYPSVAMGGDGDFVICWEDDRNGDADIYSQRYHSDGTPWGTNYLVNQRPDVPNPNQDHPAIALSNDQIAFAWQDLRRSKGWDIYAKVVTWDWEKVDEPGDNNLGLPKDFALFQNYPNPFNSSTAISYQVSAISYQRSAVSLKIYNILGQEVRTLVDGEQAPGYYAVVWDGRDGKGREVSSGVYFCRMRTPNFEEVKRLVLLR